MTINELATECLEKAKGNREEAANLFTKRIEKDNKLYKELLSPLIARAVWDTISRAAHRSRHELWQKGEMTEGSDNTEGLDLLAEYHKTLYDYPLIHGTLGDAGLAELDEMIFWHGSHEKSNGEKKRWFKSIKTAFLARKAKKVRDKISLEEMEDFQEKAKKAVTQIKSRKVRKAS